MLTWIIVGVVVLLLLGLIIIYNRLVTLNQRVKEAWSDITVQLKRRLDLIPNLVEAVKGYAKHEKQVFENVTKARAATLSAQGPAETAKAENMFEQALKSLFAVAEAYPALRATENFQQLQAELVDTEDKIQAARRFYNGSARDLNIAVQTFPNNLVAGMLGFKEKEYFELDEEQSAQAAEPVKVDFDSDEKNEDKAKK